MAGDLIPPPSPARRTDPEAETKATAELEDAVQLGAEATVPAGPSPFRSRFGFLFGVLAGLALCAAGLTVLLIGGSGKSGPQLAENWSAWEPETTRMVEGAAEIAGHVGLQYKLDSGDQLVSIRSSSLELQGEEIGVAVRPQAGSLEYLEGDGLLYILNGLGPNGTIPTGKASKKRGRLLMREALELALYSFRYLDDVTMVAVLLPQSPVTSATATQQERQTRAVFYRPGDLIEELQVPLSDTLSAKTPTPASMTRAESQRVDELTLRNLFLASVQPLEAEQNYLVLVEPDTVE
ncbi:MAG TPA: hypothetical protein VFX80_04785 [Solirubrobacteraceae bacterium]|nr:hypothetical protein [Solirubrobacteraceae bacterium]